MSTYTQLYVHVVFTVKGRNNFIKESFRNDLLNYLTGSINNRKNKVYAINAVSDHIHILFSMSPEETLSSLMRDIKRYSTELIKKKRWLQGFSWQKGYGAFSYSKSQVNRVKRYVDNQQEHHKKQSFKEEYLAILAKFKIEFIPEYSFEFYED